MFFQRAQCVPVAVGEDPCLQGPAEEPAQPAGAGLFGTTGHGTVDAGVTMEVLICYFLGVTDSVRRREKRMCSGTRKETGLLSKLFPERVGWTVKSFIREIRGVSGLD